MKHVNGDGEVVLGMPPAIAAAIIAVKKQVKQLGFDDKNDHGKYRFVSVDKFYAALGPMMAEAGLALLIDETSSAIEILETGRDGELRKTPWLFAQYALTFMHESGIVSDAMRRSLAMPVNGPQTYGASQSYIEKQFLRQVFKIPIGEKDADETAPSEDVPARGRTIPRRQEAAPAPSEAAAEATKRWNELAAAIDGEESVEMLLRLEEWPAYRSLDRIGAEAASSPAEHKEMMGLLAGRARKVAERLGQMEKFNG